MRLDQPPKVRPPKRWRFPTPIRHRLDNDLHVVVFDRPGQYVASCALVLDVPLTGEPRDQEGVATLTVRALDEGTQTHPGTAFADALESTGAELGGNVVLSATELYLDVPSGHLGEAMQLWAESVIEPTLDENDIARHQVLRLAEIDQAMAHPAHRASLAFRKAVIPSRFRASRMAGGEADTVSAVTTAEVHAFHGEFYRPSNAVLIMAGDFATNPIDLAEQAFGGWTVRSDTDPLHELPRPTTTQPTAVLIDRPHAVQADVRMGTFGIDRTDPRWPDLQMANHALGGAFLSRLNKVLREERGYTYGVHLVNHPMRHGGLVAVQGSFRTEVAVDAINEARTLLDLTNNPLTDGEITDAVNYAVGVTPLRYATASGMVEQTAVLVAAGLTCDFVDAYLESLHLVTPASATLAAEQLLKPEEFTLVVVGDAAALEGPLRDSGWEVDVES